MTRTTIGSRIPSYTGNIRVSARRAGVLALMLAQAAPRLTARQQRRLALVGTTARDVDAVMTSRERASPARLQAPRQEFTNGWAAVHDALRATARLPADLTTLGTRAQKVLDAVFSGGVAFVQQGAAEAFGTGQRLEARLRSDELDTEIDALIGPRFLEAARRGTERLGHAIGIGAELPPAPSPNALLEAVGRFHAAVGGYARSLAADVDEDDPASVARFFAAVAPIDELRTVRGVTELEEEEEQEEEGEPVVGEEEPGVDEEEDDPAGPAS